eukprot:TRINITY_DN14058_c1_g1_i2.p1 TRINITY_DN14058_c1_g1~~TRINITY_DN14058_c1_g1_i2.p1  ORF type:complete len:132 (-),score=16.27 TRINITY_DN14058_c1_g1_i2:80-475(-)
MFCFLYSLLRIQDDFAYWICYKVHNGHRVKFWHDEWCGQFVFKTQFPNLFLVDRRQEAFVAKNFSGSGGGVIWKFSFRRNLTDIEISDFTIFLGILDKVYVSVGRDDERIWKPAVKGQFSVKSFYNVLADV